MVRARVGDPPRAAKAMYAALGHSLVEFLAVAGGGPLRCTFAPGARERLDEALAGGRGVVLAASHTGNWDLAACGVAGHVPLTVVTKRLASRNLDAFWQGTRARLGITLTEAAGAVRAARSALRRGEAVAMIMDQVPLAPRHATAVTFLGAPAWADRSPAAVAAEAGAPLVVSAARREGDGQVLEVLDVLVPPPHPGPRWVEEATVRATAALAAFVFRWPDQWLWLHRRWRSPELRPRRPARAPLVTAAQRR